MEPITNVFFDYGNEFRCFVLVKEVTVNINGTPVSIRERAWVTPGDFDKVSIFSPELMPDFKALWTNKVINDWNAHLAENAPKEETDNEAIS